MESRPAASVMIIRNVTEGSGIEVLMLRRSNELDFAAGIYVFPGGAVDPDDRSLEWACLGLDDEYASKVLGLRSGGIAYFVGVTRGNLFRSWSESASFGLIQMKSTVSPSS